MGDAAGKDDDIIEPPLGWQGAAGTEARALQDRQEARWKAATLKGELIKRAT